MSSHTRGLIQELPKAISRVTAEDSFPRLNMKPRPKIRGALKPLSWGSITCPDQLFQNTSTPCSRTPPPTHTHQIQTQTQTHTPSSRQTEGGGGVRKPGRKEAGQTDRS